MAALSMVTIAALIDAPGARARSCVKALETLDVGVAFNAGLAIVVMAIVLDRLTTAASARVQDTRTGPSAGTGSRGVSSSPVSTVVALIVAYLSHTYVWAATFPTDAVPRHRRRHHHAASTPRSTGCRPTWAG